MAVKKIVELTPQLLAEWKRLTAGGQDLTRRKDKPKVSLPVIKTETAGGDPYKGYFKVKKLVETSGETTTYKLKVYDGIDEEATVCGVAVINDTYFYINGVELTITTLSTVSSTVYVYLQAILTSGTVGTPTIEQSTSAPSYQAGYTKKLLARVKFTDGVMLQPTQEHFGEWHAYIFEECE